MAQMVKHLPAVWETWVQSLGWEDPLEKETVLLLGKSHRQRSLVGYSPWNSSCQNTGAGSLSLFQGIFPAQGLNLGLPHCRQILYQLSHKGGRGPP